MPNYALQRTGTAARAHGVPAAELLLVRRLVFVIEDECHAEQHGQFATLQDALTELRRRATIPWNQEPNVAPCTNWRACGRNYELVEYDDSHYPRKELRRIPVLTISASGIHWALGWEDPQAPSSCA